MREDGPDRPLSPEDRPEGLPEADSSPAEPQPPVNDRSRWEAMEAFDDWLRKEIPAAVEAGEGGLGVEECLRLLARAWPGPRQGTGPLETGERIDRFRIERLLGHGGFGIVYLARDDLLGRWVALKIPRPHVLADPQVAARLRREAPAAAGLDHPHIVPIFETGLTGPLWYIAMQYCDGPTLAEWLHDQKQPVAPRMAAQLVARLAGALEYSHAQGVVHRDLKPANVLLFPATDDDRSQGLPFTPRLTDFGLARIQDESEGSVPVSSRTGSLTMGTPVYMAPEQITGHSTGQGVAGDLYSLGVVLYELLIGRPPFQGTSFVDVADQTRFVEPAPLRQLRRDVPADLQSICLKCLEKDPAERYAGARELRADLQRFLENRPTLVRPQSAVKRVGRWVQRHPDRAGLAALACCVLVLGLGWLVTQSRLTRERERSDLQQRTFELERDARLVGQIRQRRRSQEAGWQQRNFQELIAVGTSTTDPALRRQLRGEAVQMLSAVELRSRQLLRQGFDGYGVEYSPDGRWLAVGHNTLVDGEGLVLLYDAQSLVLRRELRFPRSAQLDVMPGRRSREDGVRSLLFSESGNELWLGTRGGKILVWDLADPDSQGEGWQAHETAVLALAQPAGRDWLVSLGNQPRPLVKVWQRETRQLLREFPLENAGSQLLTINADLLIEANSSVQRWELDPETLERRVVWQRADTAGMMAVHRDHQAVLAEHAQNIVSFRAATGDTFREWSDPRGRKIQEGRFHEMRVSPNGRWLLTSSTEGLRLWDQLSWSLAGFINNPANCRVSAAFHPHRPELVLTRDGRIEVWELAASPVMEIAGIHSSPVMDFRMSGDGRRLAEWTADTTGETRVALRTLGEPRSVQVQSVDRHPFPLLAVDASGERVLASFRSEEPSVGLIATDGAAPPIPLLTGALQACFDPSGKTIWYVGSTGENRANGNGVEEGDTGFLAAYDLESCRESFRWLNTEAQRRESVSGVLALDVGRQVVVVSSVDQRLRCFESGDGGLRWDVSLEAGLADCLVVVEERGQVVCGTRQGDLCGFDLKSGAELFRQRGQPEAVRTVTVAGELVIAGGQGGWLNAWQAREDRLEPLWQMEPFERSVLRCQLSHDGSRLALLVEGENGVRLLDLRHLRLQFSQMFINW